MTARSAPRSGQAAPTKLPGIAVFWVFLGLSLASGSVATATNAYTYDQLGRLTSALYENGSCIGYSYDAAGNRTSITNPSGGAGSSTWGTGVWGCFHWASP